MKEWVGYLGIVLVVVAVIALAAQSLIKKLKGADRAPKAEKPPRKKEKAKKSKTKKADAGFAVPGAPAPEAPQAAFSGNTPQGALSGGEAAMPMDQYGRGAQGAAGTVLMEETFTGGAEMYGIPAGTPSLRYTGVEGFPPRIPVVLRGQDFTIGRVDVALGYAQSDFEFPAETKAVSRRHAALSRDQEGYIIQDLGSKAGTFVNGMKLQPQTLYRLENGYTISFGTAGADYVWEE